MISRFLAAVSAVVEFCVLLSFANNPSRAKRLTIIGIRQTMIAMLTVLLCLFRFVRLLCSGHESVAIENAALRLQIRAYHRARKRPMLTNSDRLFWCALANVWPGWRDALPFVQPETVVRWQRRTGFGSSGLGFPGRKALSPREAMRFKASAAAHFEVGLGESSLSLGAPRGSRVNSRCWVSKFRAHGIASATHPPSEAITELEDIPEQPHRTDRVRGFLYRSDDHAQSTIRLCRHRPLCRREVLHFNVTEHPTAEWIAQQVVEACADREAPKYLIRDRDAVYGPAVRLRLQALGIQEVPTAPASPWQNAYAQRLIGSIQRECLNHFVILNVRHFRRTLASYFDYYQRSRTHLALSKDSPIPRAASGQGEIKTASYLGGLHHRYTRLAA